MAQIDMTALPAMIQEIERQIQHETKREAMLRRVIQLVITSKGKVNEYSPTH